MVKKILLFLILGTLLLPNTTAQKNKAILKDTLDGKFDMSNWVINLHGFVPYPTVISEPALGSFGVALAAVFISPKKSAKQGEQFHFPDITGVAGMWTLNNTWGVGAGRTWSDSKNLSDESWHWAGGTGFRYLIARIFKLRMGIDIAAGPGQFSYYIVFGHYWN